MNHDKLLNKLYYEDSNFTGVNPLYTLDKKHDHCPPFNFFIKQ